MKVEIIFALESCAFSRFWSRLKVLEDKFVLMFAILKPLGMQEMQFSALHHLHHLSGTV